MSNKQLEREVFIEALRCEQERLKSLVENGQLEKDKLRRETELMDVQLQLAQAELALKKQECQEKAAEARCPLRLAKRKGGPRPDRGT